MTALIPTILSDGFSTSTGGFVSSICAKSSLAYFFSGGGAGGGPCDPGPVGFTSGWVVINGIDSLILSFLFIRFAPS
jgi:hypothetical protein